MAKKNETNRDSDNTNSDKLKAKDSRYHLWQIAKDCNSRKVSENDLIFAILLLSGVPSSKSYRYAYGSEANTASCAVMGCRKTQDKEVQSFVGVMLQCYWMNYIKLNEDSFKGSKRKLWDKWRGRKIRNLEP